MQRVLLIVPSNRGTIALCSVNLYNSFQKRDDVEIKAVLIHRLIDGFPEFEQCEYCFIGERGSFIKKLFGHIMEVIWLRKIKKTFDPEISISTLLSCNTINVLTGKNDKKIGIFHAPYKQLIHKGKIIYNLSLLNYQVLYPKLDKLFCVSEEIKNSIISSFKQINPQKVSVVYNIHNIENIISYSKEELTDKEKEIITTNSVIYCGRLDKNKSPDRLLYAFIKSLEEIPENVNLIYIGDDRDGLWDDMQKTIHDNHLDGRIHFIGWQQNPYKYIFRAYCVASSSYSEGLPGVLIESLMLHKPVISTNSSQGIWEILSCYNDYDKQLNDNYVAKEGIITSNLSVEDKSLYELDIFNLSKAIKYLYSHLVKNDDFLFEKELSENNIINKYLI